MKDYKSLRIVFMGTPDFAVTSLHTLINGGCNIVGVITAPDKEAGRGMQLQQSAVKKYAVEKNLFVLQPEKLKNPQFLAALKTLNADLQIVVAFRMLPEVVWNMPPMGTVNLHGSLLPKYRGAAPINWAIINGEKETGVTTFKLQQEIDTGNILMQASFEISETDNAGSIHDTMKEVGALLLVETVRKLAEGSIEGRPQTMEYRQQTIDDRPQKIEERRRTIDDRRRTIDDRPQTIDERPQTIEVRQQTIDDRPQVPKDGESAIASGSSSSVVNGLTTIPHAPKIFTETCNINFKQTTEQVYNLIRGLSPYPAAFTFLDGKKLKIFVATKIIAQPDILPSQFKTDEKTYLYFATADGYLSVTDIQLEGKKRMEIKDFLRGYHFAK